MPVRCKQVGLATNWIALKEIFEPVVPTPLWPALLGDRVVRHGRFMMRQAEVSQDFADYMTSQVAQGAFLHTSFGGSRRFVSVCYVPLPRCALHG